MVGGKELWLYLVRFEIAPFALYPNPVCLSLDEVVSIPAFEEMSDVNSRVEKCWCELACALYRTVRQVWV